MSYIFSISFIIIGTLIGAGFVSGAEIRLFFYSFGFNGFWGIFTSSIMFGLIIYFTLQKPENSYHALLDKKFHHPVFKNIVHFIILFFLLITFFIMVAGFSSFLSQAIGLHSFIGSIVISCISFFVLISGKNGLSKLNSILVPFLIAIIILCLFAYPSGEITYHLSLSGWFTSSIIYTSYNSLLLIPVLLEIKAKNASKKNNIIISCISSLVIFICAFIVFLLLCKNSNSYFLEIPLLGILHSGNILFSFLIKLGILLAIITTALSTEYAFLKGVSKSDKKYFCNMIIISILSIFVSQIGFQNLVESLYPLFGLLGLINLFILF